MKRSPSKLRRCKWQWRILSGLLIMLLVLVVYHQLEGFFRTPQAILVLGGALEREHFAAEFARQHPYLPIWISSGSNPEYAQWLFAEAGIASDRLHLDYHAVDTVTNFTTLVDRFQEQGITSIYLITSDYHMRRAALIGEIILTSRGIDFRPIVVPSTKPPESIDKTIRDGARSLLWVTTGHTGSSLSHFFPEQPE